MYLLTLTFDSPLFGLNNDLPIYFMDDCGNIGFTNYQHAAEQITNIKFIGNLLEEIELHMLGQEIQVLTFKLELQ